MKNIRNFCIIAHIDHGKSTLADRLLELTQTVVGKDMQAQVLDDMDLERERGITIKSHAIQMDYHYQGEKYTLNLIDTPGHVDFSYEVSRSIAACEGALLIVDASQGIQAQTISNLYMALEQDLEIIPIMNKIDLPGAMPDEVEDQIVDLLGCPRESILRASGKTGEGVNDILAAIVERIKPPVGDPDAPLQCLIFDSVFNPFRGIIAYFKIVNGTINSGDMVKFVATEKEYLADEIGILRLDMVPQKRLSAGNVGYIISGIKTSKEVKVGDTITHVKTPCDSAIEGFEEVKPMVFAGVYPIETEDFEDLRASMEKLQLNDASLTFQAESSLALGFGFRCGFLGMLHMEIIQERLDREFNMDVITTVPNVRYKVYTKKGEEVEAIVLEVNPKDQRISLGLKQAQTDPWADIASKYPVGSIVKGKVSKAASFGAFIELEDGVDGLVHISQISDQRIEKVKDALDVGQDVEARVVKVDRGERRIGLSIRAMSMTEDEIKALEAEAAGEERKPVSAKTAGGENLGGLSAAFDNAFANVEWQPGEAK